MSVLLQRIDDGVMHITLNRPEALNALNLELKHELGAAIRAIADNDAARAVVLTGAGRAFCAGGDITEMDPTTPPLAVRTPATASAARGLYSAGHTGKAGDCCRQRTRPRCRTGAGPGLRHHTCGTERNSVVRVRASRSLRRLGDGILPASPSGNWARERTPFHRPPGSLQPKPRSWRWSKVSSQMTDCSRRPASSPQPSRGVPAWRSG